MSNTPQVIDISQATADQIGVNAMQLCFDLTEPRARQSDTLTSHLAAQQAKELAALHHRHILACLEAYGPLGKDGIAARSCLTGHAVGKRLAELQRLGRITLTGRTVPSTAGRAEREWRRA